MITDAKPPENKSDMPIKAVNTDVTFAGSASSRVLKATVAVPAKKTRTDRRKYI